MDYSEMSDFEINSAVHNALMDEPFKLDFLGNDKIRWVRGSTDVTTDRVDYKKNTLRDYCNNPADAWPIIADRKICLAFDVFAEPQDGGAWVASPAYGYEVERVRHDNPLRAAMVVYLMMQEAE